MIATDASLAGSGARLSLCGDDPAVLLMVLVYRSILHVNQTTVALTFLVIIQLVAFRWGLVYSVYLSLVCTLLYNYFFLPPIGSFTIAGPQNWVALLAFLASAILSAISPRAGGGKPFLSETARNGTPL